MRYSTLIALAFFLLSLGTFGQGPTEPCVSDEAMASLLTNSPEDARSYAAVKEALRNLQAQMANERTDLEVYTLPVVVHVMHLGSEVGVDENISDEQIHSAIQALNEDFRKMPGTNGDGNGVDTFMNRLGGHGRSGPNPRPRHQIPLQHRFRGSDPLPRGL